MKGILFLILILTSIVVSSCEKEDTDKRPKSIAHCDVEAEFALNQTFSVKNLSINATKWEWDFGDGTKSNEFEPSHSYKKAGNYILKLTVDDNHTVSRFIKVHNKKYAVTVTNNTYMDYEVILFNRLDDGGIGDERFRLYLLPYEITQPISYFTDSPRIGIAGILNRQYTFISLNPQYYEVKSGIKNIIAIEHNNNFTYLHNIEIDELELWLKTNSN